MKSDFLLEIGFEELPARHCRSILKQLNPEVIKKLASDHNLKLSKHQLFMTPRRLALLSESIDLKESSKEIKGPLYDVAYTDGKPNVISEKFAQSQNIDLKDLKTKSINGKKFMVAEKDLSGEFNENIQNFLDDMISTIIVDKPMRWDKSGMKFSRPIRWILCLHGKDRAQLMLGNVVSENKTYGPRFLGSKPIVVPHTKEYEDVLAKNKIIVDHEKRKLLIERVLQRIEKDNNLVVDDPDDELLDEVTFLTEYPHPFICSFIKEFLSLPTEVISTVLKSHQKYFPFLEKKSGKISHTFLVIGNYDKDSDIITKGNETVINGRLRDAVFFFKQDQQHTLSEFAKRTETITFQERLGSMSDKSVRMKKIAKKLSSHLSVYQGDLEKAADLCKADLSTNMVIEFPSLQGTMGMIYASKESMKKNVATALAEYYHPKDSSDRLPNGNIGILLSLSERIDTIYGLFSINLRPKGSSDPYALRRAAIAIVRTLWEKELDITLGQMIEAAAEAHDNDANPDEISDFLLIRLEQYLRSNEKGSVSNTNILRSVIYNSDVRIINKKRILSEIAQTASTEEFSKLFEFTKRIYNIAIKDASDKEHTTKQDIRTSSLKESDLNKSERNFLSAITALSDKKQLSVDDLSSLVSPGNTFFDKNMVMSENKAEKEKRLEILRLAYQQIERVINAKYLLS